jgi:hypothetical protein
MAHADTHHSAGNALAPANIALPAVALSFRPARALLSIAFCNCFATD